MIGRLRAYLQDPNPILVKELRAIFRANLYVRFLYLATGALAIFVLGIGATAASQGTTPARVGQVLFQLFLGLSLLVITLVAPGYASASITAEHEQHTWESLLLSGMSPWRIVFGKLAACYASIALVLIAFAPVLGIAFLFGGVAPLQVAVGFGSLLVVLLPAVAYGVAISARLRSTRLAIVIATVSFMPMMMFAFSMLGIASETVAGGWGLSMAGPFFYTEALVTRYGEWDTWAFVVGGPLYAIGMPTWFLIASAMAAVRPPSDDRAKPMKVWAIAMVAATPVGACLLVGSQDSIGSGGEAAGFSVMWMVALSTFFALLFANEPALPPRPWQRRREARKGLARLAGVFGPGAAGTLRFSIALTVVSTLVVLAAVLVTRHLVFGVNGYDFHVHEVDPVGRVWRMDLACGLLALGGLVIALFTATLATLLRLILDNGVAARVLTLAVLLATIVLPFMVALLIDVRSIEQLDYTTPLPLMISVLDPFVVAVQIADGHGTAASAIELSISLGLYSVLAVVFGSLVFLRVHRAKRFAALQRARFEEPRG